MEVRPAPAVLSCRFSDIGTGSWRDVAYAILVSMATPAGMCWSRCKCVEPRLRHVMRWRACLTLLTSCGAAFAPLAFALGRFEFVSGMILLVVIWAASYYNAMLLVRRCSMC